MQPRDEIARPAGQRCERTVEEPGTPTALARPDRAILGVLGGMGPAATVDFLDKLTKLTPASRDREHLAMVACSFPQIPNRADAILNNGPTPLPAMLHALELLQGCGASHVAIPCNTAHFWFEELQRRCSLTIIHIVDAVARALLDAGLRSSPVGLLATTATVRANVYGARLERWGLRCVTPDEDDQASIMSVVRAVKAGQIAAQHASTLRQLTARLFDRGAQSVVMGCTELPLVLGATAGVVDSTEALARACIRQLAGQPE